MTTLENVTKAAQTAGLLVSDLRAAMRTADPVVCMILERVIADAAQVRQQCERLAAAMEPQ
jgi:isochorismate hydrolase